MTKKKTWSNKRKYPNQPSHSQLGQAHRHLAQRGQGAVSARHCGSQPGVAGPSPAQSQLLPPAPAWPGPACPACPDQKNKKQENKDLKEILVFVPWEIYLKSLFFFIVLFFLVWAGWAWPGWAGAGGWGWANKARFAPWSLLHSLKADKAIQDYPQWCELLARLLARRR